MRRGRHGPKWRGAAAENRSSRLFRKGSGLILRLTARIRGIAACCPATESRFAGQNGRSFARMAAFSARVSFRGRHMGSMSLMHWLIVLAIVLVLFGAGKLPRVMGDFAKGIKAFKSGMKEEDEAAAASSPPAQVTPPAGAAASTASVGVGDRPRDHA